MKYNLINALCTFGFLMSCILYNSFDILGYKPISAVLLIAFGLGLIVNNIDEQKK